MDLYECVVCGWLGRHRQKRKLQLKDTLGVSDVCPECKGESFFRLPSHCDICSRIIEEEGHLCEISDCPHKK